MTELVDHPELLQQRIGSVRRVFAARAGVAPGAIQWRVAASTVHFGLVARLLAPALAVAVLADQAPQSPLAELFWQPVRGEPYPLSVPEPSATVLVMNGEAPSGRLAVDLSRWIMCGPIEQLTKAARVAGGVSDKVLRGNVASALHSAAQQIGTARPECAGRAVDLVDTVCNEPPLRGTGRVLPSGLYRRNSCCLIYRAVRSMPVGTGRAVCSDCVLAAD